MARESTAGRSYKRRKALSECKGSDESDEDYMVENEFDESEEEYSSYVGDESEESLGEHEDEEEDMDDELVRKKVKKVVRRRASQRKKKRSVKPRKRRRVSYREEDDDDFDNDDENDEDFRPDEVQGVDDDDVELPKAKGNELSRTRIHKSIPKVEEDDGVDGAYDEEDERSMMKGNKCIAEREEDDDEEFTLDEVQGADEEDEDDEFPVMGGNKSERTRSHMGTAKGEDDDGDDEFTLDEVHGGEEEEDDEFLVLEGNKKLERTRQHKVVAEGEEEKEEKEEEDDDDDDDNDDDDEEFVPDELDDEEDESPLPIGNGNSCKRRLRKGIAKGEEDDDDEFIPDELDEVDDDEYESPKTTGTGKLSKTQLRKGISKMEEYDDSYDEDFEFTPDEVDDLDDEEDELPTMKGRRKLQKTWLRKGTAKGEQSKTISKHSKKITKRKPRNKCGAKRKERINENCMKNGISTVEEKNKIVEGRRNKRQMIHTDSEGSRPSEYEYTISEEEREQVKEASEFCGGLTADWRCPAMSKNLIEKETPQKKRSKRKDKEKVEELKIEAGKQVCGICLSEEGKRRVRGTLNCCSHYFCFACIMEWSKVESRCPLCKQRFVTISKPAKSSSGFDLKTVFIQVPERDQVYQPSEEELRGYLDPYENVICTECQQGGDDALMLLCDLCDSPAHTYCVGLGREVPEGNWYCEGCRPTAPGSPNQQNFNHIPENRTSNNFSIGSPPVTNVRETFDLNEMYVPETPLTQENCQVPSPRISQPAFPASGSVAFTVSDRRRIQRQIHQLIMRQVDSRTTGITASAIGNNFFGSQIGQISELAPQPVVTASERAPHVSFLNGRRLQDAVSGLSHSRNAFASSSSNFNGQPFQNHPSDSVQSSVGGLLQSEFGMVNSGLVHQQLHPCSNRPNILPDAATSPYQYREATIPSRTLHGGYTHRFS